MQAGRLDRRLQFQAPHKTEDGRGNRKQGYEPQFEAAASVKPLRGGEDVLAARLEKKMPVIVTVRSSSNACQVTADWRVADSRSGEVYAIKERPRHPIDSAGRENRAFLEFLAISGAVV